MFLSLTSGTAFIAVASRPHRCRIVFSGRRFGGAGVAVRSSHSSARILKPSRRPRPDRRASTYLDDDEEVGEEENEDDEPGDDVPEFDEFGGNQYSCKKNVKLNPGARNGATGIKLSPHKCLEAGLTKTRQNRSSKKVPVDWDNESLNCGKFTRTRFQKLIEELDFDEKWFPLLDYLSTFGLKESHFISIYGRHMPSLQINLTSAKQRLTFLIGVGVHRRDIKRILVRQPQILEYTVESNMMSHVRFLLSIGVPSSRIGQIITAAPSIFSYSIEHSLKPRIRYLVEEVGIKGADVSKVVQLSPQILVQRVDNSWNTRSSFFVRRIRRFEG